MPDFRIENGTFHPVEKEWQGPIWLRVILGRDNVMSENDHRACCSLLPSQCATLNRCPLASGPSAGPAGRRVPPSSLTPARLLQVPFWDSPCLAVSQRPRVLVLGHVGECVCFERPAAGSSRWVRSVITELSGSRRVFGRSGWRWRNLPKCMLGNYQQ